MTADQNCDLCGQNDFELLATRDRQGSPLATTVCRVCGLVAHATIPSCEELQRYYAEIYRREYHGEYQPSAYRVVREWHRGARLLQRLRPSLAPRSRVLEIGSGIGCNVMNFALAGFEASGVEPGAGFSAFSREKMHAHVQSCTLEDLPASGDYDVVLLVHVLEHLPHPTRALRQIAGLLRPQGKLYVEVPNFGLPHAAPGKQFHYAHIYNFTARTLQMLTAKTGFRIERTISRPHERVLGLLLAKTASMDATIDPTSYAHTLRAVGRYSRWSYYLRSRYLIERVGIGFTRLGERYQAQQQMQQILDRCQHYAERREPKRRLDTSPTHAVQLQHA